MATKKRTKTKKGKTRKKAARKKAARKKGSRKKAGPDGNPAFDFIVAQLKKNKNAEYATIRERADAKGLTIYPVMFGRAKLLLGMVKRKPKKAAKRAPGRPRKAGGRGLGRPRKVVSAADAVQDVVSTLKSQERQNAQLQATLEKIRDLIDRVV